MKKLKIYLDTSVISHLDQQDVPDKMNDTIKLWEDIVNNKFDVVLSDVTIEEIMSCKEQKRSYLLDKIGQIATIAVVRNDEVDALANQYIENEVLKKKSYDDCLHIALAVINQCDLLISWNFKHLVNYKTIKGVKIVNAINDYREIAIISPTMLIDWEE